MKKCLSLIVLQQKNWITTAGENINAIENGKPITIVPRERIQIRAGEVLKTQIVMDQIMID